MYKRQVILDGNSDKIRFENVTIENAYGWTLGKNGQAEALYILSVSYTHLDVYKRQQWEP